MHVAAYSEWSSRLDWATGGPESISLPFTYYYMAKSLHHLVYMNAKTMCKSQEYIKK